MTRGAELQRAAVKGKRFRTKHLEVRILASPLSHPRVGFIVPKFGHSSVERNRLKRQLREIVRTRVLGNLPALDVVIRIRPSTYHAQFSVLVDELSESTRAAQGYSP